MKSDVNNYNLLKDKIIFKKKKKRIYE